MVKELKVDIVDLNNILNSRFSSKEKDLIVTSITHTFGRDKHNFFESFCRFFKKGRRTTFLCEDNRHNRSVSNTIEMLVIENRDKINLVALGEENGSKVPYDDYVVLLLNSISDQHSDYDMTSLTSLLDRFLFEVEDFIYSNLELIEGKHFFKMLETRNDCFSMSIFIEPYEGK